MFERNEELKRRVNFARLTDSTSGQKTDKLCSIKRGSF